MRMQFKRYIGNDSIVDFRSHNLRKTFLTKLNREDKRDVAYIKKYARHKKIENTAKYIEYDSNEVISFLKEQQKEINGSDIKKKRTRKAN